MKEVDKIIKRSALSEHTGYNLPYLCLLFQKKELPEASEVRIKEAVKKIIKQLQELVRNHGKK